MTKKKEGKKEAKTVVEEKSGETVVTENSEVVESTEDAIAVKPHKSGKKRRPSHKKKEQDTKPMQNVDVSESADVETLDNKQAKRKKRKVTKKAKSHPDSEPSAVDPGIDSNLGETDSDEDASEPPKSKKKSEEPEDEETKQQRRYLEYLAGNSPSCSESSDSSDDDDDDGQMNEAAEAPTRAEQRERRKLQKERLSRTVFVGNLPAWTTKKDLLKLFKAALKDAQVDPAECKVESVRLRGAVPTTGGTSKQAKKRSSIQHEFAAGDKHAQIGYVVFTSTTGVPTALKMNGHFMVKGSPEAGRHIRVDLCHLQKPTYDTQKSIFIGNLPFAADEEDVRKVFLPFGKIRRVRLVRDSATAAVKGVGFVEFEDACSVQLAVRQAAVCSDGNDAAAEAFKIGGRLLRVQAWKPMKKSKQKQSRPGKQHQVEQNGKQTVGGGGGAKPVIRVPTNLRGRAARREFVRRALKKREKRKQTAPPADAKKAPKRKKPRVKKDRWAKRV